MIGPPIDSAFYPFAELEFAKQEAIKKGIQLIDFGIGDPTDETPEFIREALKNSITPSSSYPKAAGLVELREALSQWIEGRFGVTLQQDQQILPTLGSKEIIHSLPAYTLQANKNIVITPSPAYPVYDRAVAFHGGETLHLPLQPENNFLPDLSSISPQTWERTALLWLNYPNNPTGACATMELYQQAAQLARQFNFLLASDEAYSEIYFDKQPISALQLDDLTNVVAINTLSKRSCMTGYRSGFIAGDQSVITKLKNYRSSVGVTPQDFIQRASIAAWTDENHVEHFRKRWATKRELLKTAIEASGLTTYGNATFFLWVKVPKAFINSQQFAAKLLDDGIVVSPGTFFGKLGEGFVRLALVPNLTNCQQAADQISQMDWEKND